MRFSNSGERAKGVVYVNKTAAAKRQLEAAVRMFFAGEDDLAVHTVAAASFRVLRDLTSRRGKNFISRVLEASLYKMAREHLNGSLPSEVFEGLKASGLARQIEDIAESIKSRGDEFNRSEIEVSVSKRGEEAFFPGKAANFLKHADRDADHHLQLDKLDNEDLLMRASAAYLGLMRTPSPEILVYSAYFFVEKDWDHDLTGNYAMISKLLRKSKPDKRRSASMRLIRELKKVDRKVR
jgi:hypothetical protein